MKILSAEQIRELDQYTIEHEPISSLDLMERAANRLFERFWKIVPQTDQPVCIVCGPGNNGGDGLALARLLVSAGYSVELWLCRIGRPAPDNLANRQRLPRGEKLRIREIEAGAELPDLPPESVLVDGLFGSGLSRPVEGYWADLLEHLNAQKGLRIAIDIPSGLFADRPSEGTIFQADHTLTFQLPKLAFMMPENEARVGQMVVLDIGLSEVFLQKCETDLYFSDPTTMQALHRPRAPFAHKGHFGHALLCAGSRGKMGAALLAAGGCLRAGTGLLSLQAPACGYTVLQSGAPEAMVFTDEQADHLSEFPSLEAFASIGIGPGIGQDPATRDMLFRLISTYDKPLVADADALNLLSRAPDRLGSLPKGSILTPHPGEFRRLFGDQPNGFEQLRVLREKARQLGVHIVLKGARTAVSGPDGSVWFNSTGNPGMATGGTGDVLTGILTGLLAQGYPPHDACRLGVFLHGMAGDLAEAALGQEALIAGDLIRHLPEAWIRLATGENVTP